MTVKICYVFPQINLPVYQPAARRWVESYMSNPPGVTDHEIHVCLNGGTGPGPMQERTFSPLPVRFFDHNNWAKDLGAFQLAAATIPCDLMVFFGAHIEFHEPGWLDIIVKAVEDHGPGMYGAWGFHQPAVHLRTTALFCPPELFNAYPIQISDNSRYAAEHGPQSFTLWARSMGFPTMMVTRRGVFDIPDWHHVEKSDCLFLDQHCKKIGY